MHCHNSYLSSRFLWRSRCTIHQPNALLFENFDRLLLLKKGGRCVYFGEIGQDSKVIRSYFERHGAICPQNANPAEFMLEAVGAGTAKQMGGDKDWADRWLESKEHEENIKEIQRLKTEGLEASARETEAGDSRKATSCAYSKLTRPFIMFYATHVFLFLFWVPDADATTPWFQLRTVVNRTTLAYYRNADYQLTRLFNHISIGLIVGLTFLNLQNSVAALQFRVFCIFIVVRSSQSMIFCITFFALTNCNASSHRKGGLSGSGDFFFSFITQYLS